MSEGQPTGFTTRAVHTGRGFSGTTGAVMPPVFLTSTFESGNPDGFDYTRSGNPNFRLLEASVAALEGARFATCFASGVSAITAVISSLRSSIVPSRPRWRFVGDSGFSRWPRVWGAWRASSVTRRR